jgi:hypothetical protein
MIEMILTELRCYVPQCPAQAPCPEKCGFEIVIPYSSVSFTAMKRADEYILHSTIK